MTRIHPTFSTFYPLFLCRGYKGRETTILKRATYAHFISLMRIGESSVTQESYENVQPLSYYARVKRKQVVESMKSVKFSYSLPDFLFNYCALFSPPLPSNLIYSYPLPIRIFSSLQFTPPLFSSVLYLSHFIYFCLIPTILSPLFLILLSSLPSATVGTSMCPQMLFPFLTSLLFLFFTPHSFLISPTLFLLHFY